MPLPSFLLTADLREILGDTTGAELTETAATNAVVSLTSNYPDDFPLVWASSVEHLEQPVTARVDDNGNLVNTDGDPLRLLARHADLVPNLQWRILITFPAQTVPPRPHRAFRHWWIDAGEDGDTINLANTAPVAGVPAHGSTGSGSTADEYHEYTNLAAFPGTGVTDRIYVALDTGKFYRWTGSAYQLTSDTDVAAVTHAATSKATPVDADELPLVDSAASNVLKKLTWANLKATLKTYFDSVTTTLANKSLANPTITNYTESVVAIGNTSTAKTIDLTNGTVQTAILTGNCTFTMPTATAGKSFTLLLNTGAGSFTATFTGVKWPTNVAPTITATGARLDLFTFTADGTNWYGSFAQNYTP